jgi:hypothetical protein
VAENNEYQSETLWENAHKISKMFMKKDKNGNTYFIGELNKTNTFTLRANTAKWAKEGEWELSVVPIKYSKKGNNNYTQNSNQNNNGFSTQSGSSEEIPF